MPANNQAEEGKGEETGREEKDDRPRAVGIGDQDADADGKLACREHQGDLPMGHPEFVGEQLV